MENLAGIHLLKLYISLSAAIKALADVKSRYRNTVVISMMNHIDCNNAINELYNGKPSATWTINFFTKPSLSMLTYTNIASNHRSIVDCIFHCLTLVGATHLKLR